MRRKGMEMKKHSTIAITAALGFALMGTGLTACGSAETGNGSAPAEQQTEQQAEAEPSKPEGMTKSQEQAYDKAMQYLSTKSFSHDGLIQQLEFEQFSTEDATFAADNCGADWREQACKEAKQYLSTQAFSQTGLSKQLQFEKYSVDDADYAAANCGADWNEQASKKAAQYLENQSFSHAALVDQLVFEGFTQEQAEYGVSQQGI